MCANAAGARQYRPPTARAAPLRSNGGMPSTVIRYFHHDAATGRLLVVFQSGKKYVYSPVPAATARAMRRAFSKGEFFNQHIRDRFAFERIDEA